MQAVLHHLRAKEMDWKAGKEAYDRLFEKAGGKGKGRAGAKEADPQAAKMLHEVLDHAQKKRTKKVAQVLSRHSVDELQTQLNVHLDKVVASRKSGAKKEVVEVDLDQDNGEEGDAGGSFEEEPETAAPEAAPAPVPAGKILAEPDGTHDGGGGGGDDDDDEDKQSGNDDDDDDEDEGAAAVGDEEEDEEEEERRRRRRRRRWRGGGGGGGGRRGRARTIG